MPKWTKEAMNNPEFMPVVYIGFGEGDNLVVDYQKAVILNQFAPTIASHICMLDNEAMILMTAGLLVM